MDPLYLKAILAGFCFGLWPLFMNKSGLNSVEASAALSLFLLAIATPFLLSMGFNNYRRSDGRWRSPPAYSMHWAYLRLIACCRVRQAPRREAHLL